MPVWGGLWGEPWGCPPDDENPYALLCRDLTWKQAEPWVNFKLVCEIAAEQAFEAHKEAVAIEERFGVARGFGDELDAWGEAVGFPRLGAHDGLYKQALASAGRSLLGSGDPETFHDVISLINPNALLSLSEVFPACVRLTFHNVTTLEQEIIFGLLENVPGLGICLQSVFVLDDQVFVWGHTDGDVPVPHHWSDTRGGIAPSDVAGWAVLITA